MAQPSGKTGWWAGLVDGAVRAFRVAAPHKRNAVPAAKKSVKRDPRSNGRSGAKVRDLAAEGMSRPEIARATGLSQDTVALLLNLMPSEPVESAGRGTFFRILETRMAR